LHQNLYRCAIIYTVLRKVDGFGSKGDKPCASVHAFFEPLNFYKKLKIKVMKTQSIKSTNSMIHTLSTLIVFIAVFAVTSCNSQQKPETKTAETKSTVKAPDVDIHTAVVSGNIEALKQHIAAGTNINEKDPFGGSSPLISAAVFGKPDAAKVLIEAGADVNFQNNDGSTALHTSAFFCRPEIVKMLLAKNADKGIKNKFGATAYESVAAPFESVKGAYDMMGQMLGPMGLKLDYAYIQKTRPEIAALLK
jgi:uncharacterized protein